MHPAWGCTQFIFSVFKATCKTLNISHKLKSAYQPLTFFFFIILPQQVNVLFLHSHLCTEMISIALKIGSVCYSGKWISNWQLDIQSSSNLLIPYMCIFLNSLWSTVLNAYFRPKTIPTTYYLFSKDDVDVQKFHECIWYGFITVVLKPWRTLSFLMKSSVFLKTESRRWTKSLLFESKCLSIYFNVLCSIFKFGNYEWTIL